MHPIKNKTLKKNKLIFFKCNQSIIHFQKLLQKNSLDFSFLKNQT